MRPDLSRLEQARARPSNDRLGTALSSLDHRRSRAHETRLALADCGGIDARASLAVALASLVVVDETEFAVVTSFGRIVAVYGDEPAEAGLHGKAPWQLALKIDQRVKVFDPPPREVITGDKRNLEVASYVVWRVADPVLFLRASGSHELAEARLYERVSAGLSDAIGRRELAALASTDPNRWALDDLTREVTGAVAAGARERAGSRRSGRPPAPVQSPGGGSAGRLRPDPQRAPAGRRQAAGRGRGPVRDDHQPGRPDARHDPGPGRRRGPARSAADAEAEATRVLNEPMPATPSSLSSSARSSRIARSSTGRRPSCCRRRVPCSSSCRMGPMCERPTASRGRVGLTYKKRPASHEEDPGDYPDRGRFGRRV